jgi:hypothetical protein
MDLKHVEKLLQLYEKQVVYLGELANDLILDMMMSDEHDAALVPFVDSLPDEVRQKLFSRFHDIHRADYRWRPLWIGPGGPVLGSDADDQARLRRICEVLGIG